MSNRRIKTIQTDIFSQLEAPCNDFLSSTPGLQPEKIICDDFIILANGNQIHNFTLQYSISGESFSPIRIKLLMQDSALDLEKAINAALLALAEDRNEIDDIQRWDCILDNGNRFYCACIIYQPSQYPNSNLRVKIIEKDDIGDLERAVNTFLATLITLQDPGVLRQEVILANGNRIYTCTIPYTPEID